MVNWLSNAYKFRDTQGPAGLNGPSAYKDQGGTSREPSLPLPQDRAADINLMRKEEINFLKKNVQTLLRFSQQVGWTTNPSASLKESSVFMLWKEAHACTEHKKHKK